VGNVKRKHKYDSTIYKKISDGNEINNVFNFVPLYEQKSTKHYSTIKENPAVSQEGFIQQ